MKNIFFVYCAILFFASCKKDNQELSADDGKIIRVFFSVNDHSINPANILGANKLFDDNNINHNNYRYYKYTSDSEIVYNPTRKILLQSVQVQEYINNISVLNSSLSFVFNNEHLTYFSGRKHDRTSLDKNPYLSLSELRKLFLNDIKKDGYYSSSNYSDSILKAEFGYFDLNYGTTDTTINLVKAWKVTLKSAEYPSEYPVGYYQDNSMKIGFDDGILTVN